MRIAIIFLAPFDLFSAFRAPLGGSESAATYLAIELAKVGNEVTLFSQQSNQLEAFGIRNRSIRIQGDNIELDRSLLEEVFDVIILKNGLIPLAAELKQQLHYQPQFWFWTGHAADQPALSALSQPELVQAFDGIVAVSSWHRANLIQTFALPANKVKIQLNAIAPSFENLFVDCAELEIQKQRPNPELAYTSTPFRGLDKLLNSLPALQLKIAHFSCHIYSSMRVYGVEDKDDPYQALYRQAASLPQVVYHGSLTQPALARALRKHSLLAYPNTFSETSCIAVMEALACGLQVVTVSRGALPETCQGFAKLVPSDTLTDAAPPAFISALAEACQEYSGQRSEWAQERWEQVQTINQQHTWRIRARSWQQMLQAQQQTVGAVAS